MHACDFILDVFCNGKPVQLLQEEGVTVTVSGDDGVAVKMSLAAEFLTIWKRWTEKWVYP